MLGPFQPELAWIFDHKHVDANVDGLIFDHVDAHVQRYHYEQHHLHSWLTRHVKSLGYWAMNLGHDDLALAFFTCNALDMDPSAP